jgi:NADH-quinone oxidoreductase E subunit
MSEPRAYPLTEDDRRRLARKASQFADPRSGILPGLHIAYDRYGFVNFEMYRQIAEVLNVPVVHVVEAATFYTMFPKKPAGKFHIKVCDNLSCALRGALGLIDYLEKKHGIKKGQVTPDGLFSLVGEECLAACGAAPMMQVNDRYYENLTPAKVDELIAKCRAEAKAPVEAG